MARTGGIGKPKRQGAVTAAADRLFSKLIRERDGRCMMAGLDDLACRGGLQCCHIVSRRVYALRWDELNAIAGCQAHHVFYTHHEWDWRDLIEEHFPAQFAFVQARRNEKWDRYVPLAELKDRLREIA